MMTFLIWITTIFVGECVAGAIALYGTGALTGVPEVHGALIFFIVAGILALGAPVLGIVLAMVVKDAYLAAETDHARVRAYYRNFKPKDE